MDENVIDLLFRAAKKGDLLSIEKYAQLAVNVRNTKLQTLLHVAAGYGRTNLVKNLIDQGADVNSQDFEGLCPLHNACCHKHLSTIEILLKEGAKVNLVDDRGWSPLHFALSRKVNAEKINPLYWELIQLLLEHGADPNVRTNSGRSCYDRIKNSEDKLAVKLKYLTNTCKSCENPQECHPIIDSSLTVFEFFELVKAGETYINELKLISTPNLINSRFELFHDITPLHRAAGYNHLEIAEFLVENGANVNALDANQRIPLHNASQYGHIEMMTLLVKEGSNINTQDIDGRTPLHVAAQLVTYEACLTLISLGADMTLKDNKGDLPFDIAESGDIREVLKPKEQVFATTVGDATYVALPVVKRDEPDVYSSVLDQLMMNSGSDKPLFTSTDKHDIKKIFLQESDSRFQMIKNRMLKTIVPHDTDLLCKYNTYEITSIQLILNQKVWTNYCLMCQILENKDGFKNERLLFHGSNFIDQIQNNGFDERYAQHDGMFGPGIYFARHSSKSNQYTFGFGKGCQKHNDISCYICERQIIYAQVALGRSFVSKAANPRCPHGPPGYSSITGLPDVTDGLQYHEYVIYKGAQAYPLFVIRYKIKR